MSTTADIQHSGGPPSTSTEKGPITTAHHDHHGTHHQHNEYQKHHHYGPMSTADPGSLHPGMWKPYEHRKFANPAPLGLSAFALTTFVLSAINMHARDVTVPNVAVSLAFGYGGLVQLLAGMWEMAVGNTFGATALSSYGGFWIAYAILLTPAWGITNTETGPYADNPADIFSVLGFFLTGWFIFTFILLLCTLKSTLVFFSLFLTLDLAFLFLACENYAANLGNDAAKNALQITGGVFGMLAAFLAWYCALEGLQDEHNSFFKLPVYHFPWSTKAKEMKAAKSERAMA
jgi:succinate-acetate transporter protein